MGGLGNCELFGAQLQYPQWMSVQYPQWMSLGGATKRRKFTFGALKAFSSLLFLLPFALGTLYTAAYVALVLIFSSCVVLCGVSMHWDLHRARAEVVGWIFLFQPCLGNPWEPSPQVVAQMSPGCSLIGMFIM